MISRRAFLSALVVTPVAVAVAKPSLADLQRRAVDYRALQLQAMQQVPRAPFVYKPDSFIVPTWDEVQSHYAAKYGAVNTFMHPRMRDDVERIAVEITRPPSRS